MQKPNLTTYFYVACCLITLKALGSQLAGAPCAALFLVASLLRPGDVVEALTEHLVG